MSDLIDRQAAIDEIDEWIKAFLENGHKESAADACLIQDGIIQLPSVQPEREKGRWIDANEGKWNTIVVFKCSVCGEVDSRIDESDNFCPNCGADMRCGDTE